MHLNTLLRLETGSLVIKQKTRDRVLPSWLFLAEDSFLTVTVSTRGCRMESITQIELIKRYSVCVHVTQSIMSYRLNIMGFFYYG